MSSRREFLSKTATLAAGISTTSNVVPTADKNFKACVNEISSLCGEWLFSVDADDSGIRERWFEPSFATASWIKVNVPHTWQIDSRFVDHRGPAWYRRRFDVPAAWTESAVRIEFEAVFHTATVWVN